jgi:uncharacterized protein YkwD/LysM repeat protein
MMKKLLIPAGLALILVLELVSTSSASPRLPSENPSLDPGPAAPAAAVTDPSALIAEVNALRAANGLPPYAANPILMAVAQAHSVYMATSGNVTHYGPDGSRPFQRALAAGYPVSGDLSLGGFYSENIIAGPDMSVSAAVSAWQGDAPHLNTMLSPNFTEAGVGASIVDGYVYYVLDASRPAGTFPSYTPPAGGPTPGPIAVPVIPNTPNADGSLVHIVKAGEALWTIAAVYETTVEDVLELNGLKNSYIYPGDRLVIRTAFTPTPVTPSPFSTRTDRPTSTPSATATAALTATSSPFPRAAPAAGGGGTIAVAGIVIAALLAAGVITLISSRRETLR